MRADGLDRVVEAVALLTEVARNLVIAIPQLR